MAITVDSISPTVVESEGGRLLTVTGTGFELLKTYNIHVGAADDATDPACYAGAGKGINVTPKSVTSLECFLPELPTGTILDVFGVQSDDAGTNDSLADAMTVIEPQESSSRFSMRRLFAPNRRVGKRTYDLFPAVDKPNQFLLETDTLDISPWFFSDANAAISAEDPFGGTNGWELNEGSSIDRQALEQVSSNTGLLVAERAITMSCYVKASNRTFCSLEGQTPDFEQTFNLTTGVVGSTQVDASNRILGVAIKTVDLATGWFRVSITFRGQGGSPFTWSLHARDGDNVNDYQGLSQQAILMAFPALDPYPLPRGYREAGSVAP